VAQKGAQGGGCGRGLKASSLHPAGHADAGQQSRRGRFHVPLDSGDLSPKKKTRPREKRQVAPQQGRRFQEGVPVDASVAGEFRILQTRNGAEDPLLFRPCQFRLKSHEIEQRALAVFSAQLDNRVRRRSRARIGEPHRLHRTEAERIDPPVCQHLDRQAAFEIGRLFERTRLDRPPRQDLRPDCLVLLFRQGTIPVVAAAVGVPRGAEHPLVMKAGRIHDRRNGVIEEEMVLPRQRGDFSGEGVRRQGSRGDEDRFTVGDPRHLLPADFNVPGAGQALFDVAGKFDPVHGQRPVGRNRRRLRGFEKERTEEAHFSLEDAGCGIGAVGPQGIAADELRQKRGAVGRRKTRRLHLEQLNRKAGSGQLPGGFASRQAAADHDHGPGFIHFGGPCSCTCIPSGSMRGRCRRCA